MKKDFDALMELIPEQYIEEAAAYRQAHSGAAKPRIHWVAPVSIAACAVLGIGGVMLYRGSEDNQFAYDSTPKQMTEIQPAKTVPTETATETVTAATIATVKELTQTTADATTAKTVTVTTTAKTAGNHIETQTAATAKSAAQTQTVTETAPAPTVPDILNLYQLGDVNMDGRVDVNDAQLLLWEYNAVVIEGGESTLTADQIRLGDVTDEWDPHTDEFSTLIVETDYPISMADVDLILLYYSQCTAAEKYYRWYSFEMWRDNGNPTDEEIARHPADIWMNTFDGSDLNVPVDLNAQTLTVDSFGTFPLQIGTENPWNLTRYSYYDSAWDPEAIIYEKTSTACYGKENDVSVYLKMNRIIGGAEGALEKRRSGRPDDYIQENINIGGRDVLITQNRNMVFWADGDWLMEIELRGGVEWLQMSDDERYDHLVMIAESLITQTVTQ